MILVCIKSSVATKNGNKEGMTELAHKDKPDLTACKLDLENISKQMVNNKNKIGKKFFLNFEIGIILPPK